MLRSRQDNYTETAHLKFVFTCNEGVAMSLWGDIKSVAKGAVSIVKKIVKKAKDGLRTIWHKIGGFIAIAVNIVKDFVSHIALIWEIPMIYLFNWMPEKKLKLRVIILNDTNRKPLASRDQVEQAVQIAQAVFKKELNVRVTGTQGRIIDQSPEPSPGYVLTVPCSTGPSDVIKQLNKITSRAGAWYRSRVARTIGSYVGYGTPITMFVVAKITPAKVGCANIAWFENYGWIVPSALPSGHFNPKDYTTLPHEMGHCCDLLFHRKPKVNLMHGEQTTRTDTKLTKWQKCVARTSTHVTYR